MLYFKEKKEYVSLKEELEKSPAYIYKRVKRLYDALGDIYISKEFLDGFLEYYSYRDSRRADAPLTMEAIETLYRLSEKYSLSSLSIKMLMGEYIKDLFYEEPLKYFDSMSIEERERSFEGFFKKLKIMADKRDLEYIEEAKKADELSYMYGERFSAFIKDIIVKYHCTYDEVYYSIPHSWIMRKDSDLFYDIAKKELFGAFGYPYSYLMCKQMILFDEIDSYKDRDLIYSSSLKGEITSPITAEEFLRSVEEKRKSLVLRKK